MRKPTTTSKKTPILNINFLKNTPLFCDLPIAALKNIAKKFKRQELTDGSILFRQGDDGDAFFIIAKGSLEVVRFDHKCRESIIVRTLQIGECVGEMAILLKQRRNSTLKAKGDTLVFVLHSQDFLYLIQKWPTISLNIAQTLSQRLNVVQDHIYKDRQVNIWGIAECKSLKDDFLLSLVKNYIKLKEKNNKHVNILILKKETTSIKNYTHELLNDNNQIHIENTTSKQYNDTQYDLIIHHDNIDNLLTHESSIQTIIYDQEYTAINPKIRPEIQYMVFSKQGIPSKNCVINHNNGNTTDDTIARLVRLLLKQSIGIALGGGAALGFAHLGVLLQLQKIGIPIDFIAGTSMGALLGVMYAAIGIKDTIKIAKSMKTPWHWLSLIDSSFIYSGLIKGEKIGQFIDAKMQQKKFSELNIPVSTVAFDLTLAKEHVFNQGFLKTGILSSISIPGLFTPQYCVIDSSSNELAHAFIDGGVINNVPVNVVKEMGADHIIGVHVISAQSQEAIMSHHQNTSGQIFKAVNNYSQKLNLGARLQMLLRANHLLMAGAGKEQIKEADIAIIADTSQFGFLEFWKAEEIIKTGEKATLLKNQELIKLI